MHRATEFLDHGDQLPQTLSNDTDYTVHVKGLTLGSLDQSEVKLRHLVLMFTKWQMVTPSEDTHISERSTLQIYKYFDLCIGMFR